MPVEKRVLVPGAGGPGAVNLTRGLRMAPEPVFTVGCDASPYYVHLALTDVKVRVPRVREEDAYVATLRDLCERHRLNLLYPNSSVEMMVLTRRHAELPAAMRVPSLATQEVAASKWLTWQRLAAAGLPVPRTVVIDGPQDVERAFDEIPTRPVWFRGAGIPGRGVGGAALPCTEPVQALGWISFYQGYGAFIASEFLPGDNLTFLGIFDHGRLVVSQGRQRDLYVIPHVSPSGITGAPAVCHTVHRQDLNDLGERAVLALDPEYDGVAFVDFKGDADGRILPTEVNAGRFGTTHHFYTAAGAPFPWWMLRIAFGEDLPALPPYDVLPADLYWIRTLDAGPVLLKKEDLDL
jgi:carbamoyl-phosphate synthase large subunit